MKYRTRGFEYYSGEKTFHSLFYIFVMMCRRHFVLYHLASAQYSSTEIAQYSSTNNSLDIWLGFLCDFVLLPTLFLVSPTMSFTVLKSMMKEFIICHYSVLLWYECFPRKCSRTHTHSDRKLDESFSWYNKRSRIHVIVLNIAPLVWQFEHTKTCTQLSGHAQT